MIGNYLKTSFKSIKHHKSFSLLNILGLGIGMGCSILIFLWVANELSYDRFNVNAGSLYRITSDINGSKAAVIPVPMGIAVRQTIPGVVSVTRLKATDAIFTVNNEKFEEKRGYYTDTNFLRMFSYPLTSGRIADALASPGTVVITASLAKKYFGSIDAVGKTLVVDNDIKTNTLTVSGVLEDVPANSHLQFDFLLPMQLYEKHIDYDGSWGNFDMYTYVQMDKRFQPGRIAGTNRALFDLCARNENEAVKGDFTMQPLTAIHLYSGHLLLDVDGQGNIEFVRIFSIVGLFTILIACINFMNLSTAMAGQRAKEVGLRKTIGALRSQLIGQFLSESVLLAFMALLLGVIMAGVFLPLFNTLTGKEFSIRMIDTRTIVLLCVSALVVGLFSGSYPAFYLSSFKPIKVLKGLRALPGQKAFLRNGLVVVQFSISIVLIVGTLVVYNQLRYIRTRDMGFKKENLLYIAMPRVGDLGNNYQALKATLRQYPGISDFTIVNYLPTNLTTGTDDVLWPGKDPHLQVIFPHLGVDENFARTFGMHLVAGRFFAKDFQGDEHNFVVNETALTFMHVNAASAIGMPLSVNGKKGMIIGVLKDFNFKPVHQAVQPLILKSTGSGGNLVIRTSPENMPGILAQVKKVFRNVYADYPFSYGFVDEELARLYRSEQQMGSLLGVFTALSVIISCLGLFGLATYAAQKRFKEIGVRKVLGASVASIVKMLSKDFLKPIVIGAVIAFPAAWWLMSKWLQGFAYRVGIDWTVFALAGGLAFLVAFAAVIVQTMKAAVANPVKSLRSE
jgi:putative ABC transport system permease protein